MIKHLIQIITLVLIFTNNAFCQLGKEYKHLNPEAFYVAINEDNNSILIDCREIKAYWKIAIEGSINLENKKQVQSFCDTLDQETPILVYCDVGSRSKKVCKHISKLGFVSVYNLKGGLHNWKSDGYPVKEFVKPKKPN